jgi:hypothetical protein
MTEAEFRDLMRRHYGALEDRMKALEKAFSPWLKGNAVPRVKEAAAQRDIETLAALALERAKSGEVTSIALVMVAQDGWVEPLFGGQNFDKYALLGAIAVLQQGVMNARGEGEGEVDGQETVSGGELRPVENPV